MPVRVPGGGLVESGSAALDFGPDCVRRAIEIEFVDRSVALASLGSAALDPSGW